MAHWNLTRLAEALLPHLSSDMDQAQGVAQEALEKFGEEFKAEYISRFSKKLGIKNDGVDTFINDTLSLLANQSIDFTLFFTRLTAYAGGGEKGELLALFSDASLCEEWLGKWPGLQSSEGAEGMKKVNPILIPRNHLVERAIQAAHQGDYYVFERLNKAWKNPYVFDAEFEDLQSPALPHEKVYQTFCGT
jgi:uncharacterized protein YdiU (UPF0061 family)